MERDGSSKLCKDTMISEIKFWFEFLGKMVTFFFFWFWLDLLRITTAYCMGKAVGGGMMKLGLCLCT